MLRFEVLFKKFHPRINLTTLFFTKIYLRNTFKLLLGHENWSLGPKQHNLKKPQNNLKSINILSMRYIKLAQMNFSFLAHKAEAVGVTQICANGGGGGDGNGA
jgi:hypothetical protein